MTADLQTPDREEADRLVVFTLDDRRFGLPLSSIERVVRIVEVTPLPKAPGIVLGIVNLRGRVIPVIDVRRRFRLPERAIALTDQLLIACTSRRPVALIADAVIGVLEYSRREAVPAGEVAPALQWIEGVVKLADGLILIHDLDTFLSIEEEANLTQAVEADA